MYAVIRTGGKQYRVAKNDVIKIERLPGEPGQSIEFDDVLAIGGEQTIIGTPKVEGAKVMGLLLDRTRAPKIIVFKKKRRKNYRRKKGHRQNISVVRITDIVAPPSA